MKSLTFAEDTTIHGIKNITRAIRRWQAIMWSVVVLGAVSYGVKSSIALVVWYLSEPTSLKAIYVPSNQIPDMVYCPHAWINVTKAHQQGFDDAMIAVASSSVRNRLSSPRRNEFLAKFASSHVSALNRLVALNQTVRDVHMSIAYDAHDVIKAVSLYPHGEATNYTVIPHPRVTGVCYTVRIHHTISTILAPFTRAEIFTLENPALYADINPYNSNYWEVGFVQSTMSIGARRVAQGQDAIFRMERFARKFVSTKNFECVDNDVSKFAECIMKRLQPVCKSFSGRTFYDAKSNQTFSEIQLQTSMIFCENPETTGSDYYKAFRETAMCKYPCEGSLVLGSLLHVNNTWNVYPGTVSVAFKFQNSLIQAGIQERMYSLPTTVSQVGGVLALWTGASFVSLIQIAFFILPCHNRDERS